MKNKKNIIFVFLIATFLLTACASKVNDNDNTIEDQTNEAETESESTSNELDASLEGLTKDEYKDLEITAELKEQSSFQPGSTVPVEVTIKNNGDKSIAYTIGSGSFETPQALMLTTDELQPILAKDHLDAATLDIRTSELMPGESIQHTMYIRAIEPNENFANYTYEKWEASEEYIGDTTWENLQAEHSDLTASQPGEYTGTVYFLYYINDEEEVNPTLNATGYTACDFTVNIAK